MMFNIFFSQVPVLMWLAHLLIFLSPLTTMIQ